jgi:hypothetical protein
VKAGQLTGTFWVRKICHNFWIYFLMIPIFGMVRHRCMAVRALYVPPFAKARRIDTRLAVEVVEKGIGRGSELQFERELCGARAA